MLRLATVIAVLAVIGAFLFSKFTAQDDRFLFQTIHGKNNTVLFVTDEHPGFCNVHLATLYSLLENHPEIKIHYASFSKTGRRLKQISSLAAERGSRAQDVKFHLLSGLGYAATLEKVMGKQQDLAHRPGLAAADFLSRSFRYFLAPWPVEEYWMLYESLSQLIDEVDPAVIVIDTFFSPGIDAARNKRRLHALVTPNILSDLMPAGQPAWTLLWKYPALGSGIPYPVPWRLIPANIYMNIRIIRGMTNLPDISAKRKSLEKKGIKRPIDFMGLYRPDVPWLTQTLPGVHLPLVNIPRNVTLTGPINLAGLEEKTAAAQELLDWVKKPTVLISFGSGFKFLEHQTRIVLAAIQNVLRETNVQVLWRMDKLEPFDDQFLKTAVRESSDRLRVEKWLEVGPPTLLQNGHIVAFVHHGGAGCFHDSIEGGVPQVILPQWADLYDFAQLAESLDIGMWACRETSPDWTAECIERALLHVTKDSVASVSMAKKAASIGSRARKSVGRDIAAREIAVLAASGHS
ncbi:glycosyltransferase family 1 protein [Lipomyces orientalis]|uniref:Glycosyltransferase family 1 protein n=1 Tax=Lipomyces orientalis TaxID=1233043 RepID=A0ACC3THD0_9ASCO